MGGEAVGGRVEEPRVEPLPPELEARVTRRIYLLLGLVPLPELSQAEADWVFRQRLRLGGDD